MSFEMFGLLPWILFGITLTLYIRRRKHNDHVHTGIHCLGSSSLRELQTIVDENRVALERILARVQNRAKPRIILGPETIVPNVNKEWEALAKQHDKEKCDAEQALRKVTMELDTMRHECNLAKMELAKQTDRLAAVTQQLEACEAERSRWEAQATQLESQVTQLKASLAETTQALESKHRKHQDARSIDENRAHALEQLTGQRAPPQLTSSLLDSNGGMPQWLQRVSSASEDGDDEHDDMLSRRSVPKPLSLQPSKSPLPMPSTTRSQQELSASHSSLRHSLSALIQKPSSVRSNRSDHALHRQQIRALRILLAEQEQRNDRLQEHIEILNNQLDMCLNPTKNDNSRRMTQLDH